MKLSMEIVKEKHQAPYYGEYVFECRDWSVIMALLCVSGLSRFCTRRNALLFSKLCRGRKLLIKKLIEEMIEVVLKKFVLERRDLLRLFTLSAVAACHGFDAGIKVSWKRKSLSGIVVFQLTPKIFLLFRETETILDFCQTLCRKKRICLGYAETMVIFSFHQKILKLIQKP